MEIKFKKIFNVKIFLIITLFVFTNLYTENKESNTKNGNVQKIFYDIDLQPFGKFKLIGTIDIQNSEFSLEGRPKNAYFNNGFLTIKNPTIGITNKKGLVAHADVTIFNQKATLGISEFRPPKILIYDIIPEKEIAIPITPWNKTDINKLSLSVKNKVLELAANVQIFGKPNIIKFVKTKASKKSNKAEITPQNIGETAERKKGNPNNYAELTLENIKPSDIIKSMSGNKFDTIIFEHALFRIDNPFSKKAEHHITITTTTNLEGLGLPLNVNLSKVDAIIGMDKTTGLTLTTSIPKIRIMNDSELKNISLKIILPPKIKSQTNQSNTKTSSPNKTAITNKESIKEEAQQTQVNKPSIFLSGIANLKLPIGKKINGYFHAIYDNGIFNFETKTTKQINFANNFHLKNVTIRYSSLGGIEITGNTKIFNLDLIGKLKLSKTVHQKASLSTSPNSAEKPAPKALKVGGYYAEFSATSKTNKPIKPFADIPELRNIKQITNISVSNPGLGMSSNKTFYITGQSDILGFKSNVKIELENKKKITLKSPLPKNWKLSDTIKPLKGTLFDDINLSDAQIVISSFAHFDNELQVQIKKGINVTGKGQLTGSKFKSAKNIVPQLKKKLKVITAIGSSPSDINLSMAIPMKEIPISKKATLKNVSFFINGAGPSMGLKTQIMILPDKKDKPLLFTGEVSIDPAEAGGKLSATMQGKWKHPLGISGISLSNLAIEGTVPALTDMGITGNMLIGADKEVSIAAKYAVDGELVLLGKYKGQLLLGDLISMVMKLNKHLNIEQFKNKFPKIGLENMLFKFAPRSTNIGEIHFDAGTSLKGTLLVLNKKGSIDVNLGSKGIFAKGTLDKFNIGPIEISGAGLDGTYGTKDDGAVIDFVLSPKKQHLILSGLVDLKVIEAEGDMHIGTDKISIFLEAKLLEKFKTDFAFYSIGSLKKPANLDFAFKAIASNEMNDYLMDQIKKTFDSFKNKLSTKRDKIKEKMHIGPTGREEKTLYAFNSSLKNSLNNEINNYLTEQIINETKAIQNKIKVKTDITSLEPAETILCTNFLSTLKKGIGETAGKAKEALAKKEREAAAAAQRAKEALAKKEREAAAAAQRAKKALAKKEREAAAAAQRATKALAKKEREAAAAAQRATEALAEKEREAAAAAQKATKALAKKEREVVVAAGRAAEKANEAIGKTAENIGESARKISEKVGETEQNVMKAANRATASLDDAAKHLAAGLVNIGEEALLKALDTINIKKVEISGRARALANGIFPKFHIEIDIAGHPKEINIQLDLNNMEEGIKQLGENILKAVGLKI